MTAKRRSQLRASILLHIRGRALETIAAMKHESNLLRRPHALRLLAFFGAITVGAATAVALEQKKVEPAKGDEKAQPTEIQQFCNNNAAIIGDARLSWQTARLLSIETEIRQRLAELEVKKAEYVEWLKKREEAMKQASESVVAIYARMRPEAAALQISAMEDAMAAAILAKF